MSADHPTRFERRKPQDPITRRDESLAFVASDQTWRAPDWFGRLAVVLVEPTDPVNIGGVVRSMANTGFLNLRLVRPVGFDPWHVVGIAHYTQHIIEATCQFESLPDAVADRHFVLGLTGRHHRVGRNRLPFQEAMDRLAATARANQEVAVVFGREDWGMSNVMLDACHAVTTIPTNPAYPSLNLAQATLLVLYQLFQRAGGEDQSARLPRQTAPPATSGLLEDMFADLERALDAIGFLEHRARDHTLRSLRVALFRARLDVREASLFRAMVIEIRRYMHRTGVLSEVGLVGMRLARQRGMNDAQESHTERESDRESVAADRSRPEAGAGQAAVDPSSPEALADLEWAAPPPRPDLGAAATPGPAAGPAGPNPKPPVQTLSPGPDTDPVS